jgi:predicted nucleotidyltransferase
LGDVKMKRSSLIGFALSFASFLLDSNIGDKINKIILFGSVARGDFSEESDIDLFIDTRHMLEDDVERVLTAFRYSKINETWKLKGIKQEISLKIGDLNKWPLKRNVISSGILLYGKYNEVPENIKYYLMISMSLKNLKFSNQMKLWRKLYGYRQKIGNKIYVGKGLVEKLEGRKIGKAIILVPMQNRKEILDFLNKSKIKYRVNELWSDSF